MSNEIVRKFIDINNIGLDDSRYCDLRVLYFKDASSSQADYDVISKVIINYQYGPNASHLITIIDLDTNKYYTGLKPYRNKTSFKIIGTNLEFRGIDSQSKHGGGKYKIYFSKP